MTNNSRTNSLLKYAVMAVDFILLNALLYLCVLYYPRIADWPSHKVRLFAITLNLALLISHYYNSPIIHQRVVSVGDIIRRIVRLTGLTVLIAYLIMKGISLTQTRVGVQLMEVGTCFFFILLIARYFERMVIKYYRQKGRNTRAVLFVGADPELLSVYTRLKDDASKGYKIKGYYADNDMNGMPEGMEIKKLGTLKDLMDKVASGDADDQFGDEVYVCLSRLKRDVIRQISNYCDQKLVRFYYVPISVESLGLSLKREALDDIEVFTTYENPLQNSVNRAEKRAFDLLMAMIFMIPTLVVFPIVWIMIKIQSPGPIFFKQKRTGLDGKDFNLYKFRSMHVNKDADKVQATKDDPRKYPFGNFMRKANIDEVPQIFNIIKGDMSVVGPRPHMLAHTEQYSQLIDKYMVRHFVKPGVTGWAQVTGYRGETNELWQMEGRVKRDIWYMEHWSIWLDIRIIWMTLKTFFVHDKKAY